jgi:hypothetical protein
MRTPHQYVMRARLREAASRLATGTQKELDGRARLWLLRHLELQSSVPH